MVVDDHDPDTSHHDSVNDESPNRPGTSDRFVPWSQYMQLINRVSVRDGGVAVVKMQYEFLNKRFDGLEKNIEIAMNKSERSFEIMGSEINRRFEAVDRRFEAMDRKLTTWFLGLLGLIVAKGGFDFFSDKNRAGNSK